MDSGDSRDWMFDPTSGFMLEFTPEGAVCPYTNYRRDLKEFENVRIIHKCDMKGFFRRYGLEPLVQKSQLKTDAPGAKDAATTDERCPKCNKKGLSFFTLQLRSADEGQTVFYECRDCGHKYSQNN